MSDTLSLSRVSLRLVHVSTVLVLHDNKMIKSCRMQLDESCSRVMNTLTDISVLHNMCLKLLHRSIQLSRPRQRKEVALLISTTIHKS